MGADCHADEPDRRWSAVILTGGASKRMGRDKALLPVDGAPMAVRVAHALHAAGADDVTCVGGDLGSLRSHHLDAIADDWPDEGPVAGLLTGIAHARHDVVVVTACDLVAPDPNSFSELVDAVTAAGAAAALPLVDGVERPTPAAVRRTAAPQIRASFDAGERAMHRALRPLDPVRVPLDHAAIADADSPGDLPGGR